MGGSFIFEHRVPDADAAFIPRLRQAGGIFVGKTTTPEFGWKALGDSPLTGIPAILGTSRARPAAAAPERRRPVPPGSDRCMSAATVQARSAYPAPSPAFSD